MSQILLEQDEEKFYKQVEIEFGKKKKEIEEYVTMLLKWSQEQSHFPEIPSINGILLSIVACKFSVEKAKKKLDMYYTIRNILPEIFTKHPLTPEMILQSKIVLCVPLPKTTSKNERILYSQITPNYPAEDFNHELFLVQLNHLIEVIIQEDKCYTFHMIFDCLGAKMGHITKFSPMVVKKLGICIEEVYANRIASVCIINFYPFLEHLLQTVFRPFLPAKIRDRLRVLESPDILLKEFGKSIMPKDIGGEEMSLEELRVLLIEKYQKWKPRFDAIQYMKVDESLRPSKLENDAILGYYGSFKQISLD